MMPEISLRRWFAGKPALLSGGPDAAEGLILASGAAIACYWVFLRQAMGLGVIAYNICPSERLLWGEAPYRDFLYNYTPGLLWVNAGLMKLFGANLMTVHVGLLLFKTASVATLFLAARQVIRGWMAFCPVVLALAWIGSGNIFSVFPSQYSMPFVFLGTIFFMRHDRSEKLRDLVYCGFCLGVVVLFKHNVGIYLTGAATLAMGLREAALRGQDSGRAFLSKTMALGAGLMAALLPLLVYLVWNRALGAMVHHFWRHAAEYVQERAVSPPTLAYAPFVLFTGVLVWVMAKRAQNGGWSPELWRSEGPRIAVALFALATYLEIYPRADETHVFRALAPTFLLFGICLSDLVSWLRSRPRADSRVPGLVGLVLLLPLAAVGVARGWVPQFDASLHLQAGTPLTGDRSEGIRGEPEAAETIERLMDVIERGSGPGESMYSFARRGAAFNFLAARRNPTRLLWWDSSGVPDEERETVLGLVEEAVPKLILISTKQSDGRIRALIASRYVWVETVSEIEVFSRKRG